MTQKSYNLEEISLVRLYVATDAQMRLRLSADMVALYDVKSGVRVRLSFDRDAKVIGIRPTSAGDPLGATVDARGYISAREFYRKTKIPAEAQRYVFEHVQDGIYVFKSE